MISLAYKKTNDDDFDHAYFILEDPGEQLLYCCHVLQ